MTITVTPVKDAFVARICGVDLRADHSPTVLAAIEEALDRYAVVILPGIVGGLFFPVCGREADAGEEVEGKEAEVHGDSDALLCFTGDGE